MKILLFAACGFIFMAGAGCRANLPVPVSAPATPPQQIPSPLPSEFDTLKSHLEGRWRNLEKREKIVTVNFDAQGGVHFQGGLEFFNPGHWTIDADHHQLNILLPQADVDRLRVFQLSVGDGVQSFNPAEKKITYRFDENTWTLNIAGWTYTREDVPVIKAAPQPALD